MSEKLRTICDKVQETYQKKGEHKNVIINFRKSDSNRCIVVVIFGNDLINTNNICKIVQ
jgi:hypothetical protein